MKKLIRLGVNVDHVATIRQARGSIYPDPVQAAMLSIEAGADGITLHLREDRRHIQEHDVALLIERCTVPVNLEMAATNVMVAIAEKYRPAHCCLVPEKREELTTEGGLDVVANKAQVTEACQRLAASGIEVALFIDPAIAQIDAAVRCGAPVIEIHTGHYANVYTHANAASKTDELQRIRQVASYAHRRGLIVNAGHGLDYDNVKAIAAIPEINELNIGHSIIAQAIFDGLGEAVRRMKSLMYTARH